MEKEAKEKKSKKENEEKVIEKKEKTSKNKEKVSKVKETTEHEKKEISKKEKFKIDFLEEKIKEKKKIKLPKLSIQKIIQCVLLAIFCIIYFLIVNETYKALSLGTFEKAIHIFSGIYVLIGIIFLEKLYKEEILEKAISAIEFFALGIHSLSLIYVISKYNIELKTYLIFSSYIFTIYYIVKAIAIFFKARKEYLSSLSDVKEIVKKEEPIKKEATKRRKKKKINRNKTKKEVEVND